MDSGLLFDDVFTISATSKTFDRVVRVTAKSELHEMDIVLDVRGSRRSSCADSHRSIRTCTR